VPEHLRDLAGGSVEGQGGDGFQVVDRDESVEWLFSHDLDYCHGLILPRMFLRDNPE
jgi:hypothetical protein